MDPYIDAPLSTLQITAEGLRQRDELVARFARDHDAGLVILAAGGYSEASPGLIADGMAAVAAVARDVTGIASAAAVGGESTAIRPLQRARWHKRARSR